MANERRSRFERVLGFAGLALGIAVVAVAVSGWKVPTGNGSLGSDLYFSSGPTGELEVTPSGPFLSAHGLRPHDRPAVGRLALLNQTGSTLAVRLHALPDRPDLDRLLVVQIASGSRIVFRGTLGELAAGTSGLFELEPAERTRLRFEVWLRPDAERGYQGRIVSAPFQIEAMPA